MDALSLETRYGGKTHWPDKAQKRKIKSKLDKLETQKSEPHLTCQVKGQKQKLSKKEK